MSIIYCDYNRKLHASEEVFSRSYDPSHMLRVSFRQRKKKSAVKQVEQQQEHQQQQRQHEKVKEQSPESQQQVQVKPIEAKTESVGDMNTQGALGFVGFCCKVN